MKYHNSSLQLCKTVQFDKSTKVPGKHPTYVFKMTLFYTEDEGSRFSRNFGRLLTSYTVSYLRRP